MTTDNGDPTRKATWSRKLHASGDSTLVTLPPQLLQLGEMESGDEVTLTAQLGEPVITIEKTNMAESNRDDSASDGG